MLLRGSRPALGEEGHWREEVRPGPRLHGPRRGPGGDPAQAPQDQRAVHHAEAPRSAGREGQSLRGRHPRRVLRRHDDGAAIRALHRRGSAGGAHRLLPDLRQHADGPGGQRAAAAGGQLLDHLLRAAAARRAPRREPEPDRASGGLRHLGPGGTDHADQGVLPAALPRTRRSHPPPAARALSPGTAWARCRPFGAMEKTIVEGVY